jgi:peroxiredoxin
MLVAGSHAPTFKLKCSQYRATTLEDYRGKRLILAFYVADWHPVCTAQLQRYRELLPDLQRLSAELVAISADTVWSHAAFASAYQLPFPLLSDDRPRGRTARAYGVREAPRQGGRRGLCLIDTDGTIAWSAAFPEAVDPGADGFLTALEALSAPVGRVGGDAPRPHPTVRCRRPSHILQRSGRAQIRP